jgi:hypothetical protein
MSVAGGAGGGAAAASAVSAGAVDVIPVALTVLLVCVAFGELYDRLFGWSGGDV